MNKTMTLLKSALLAGICIGIAGFGYLAVGGIAGAVAFCCGFLMTTAVTFARKEQWLPLLFCVPMFIFCGFPHCVADAFYYLTCSLSFWGAHFWQIILLYVAIVLGNFLGCNLYRFIMSSTQPL